jgi:ribosomal protein S27AE
MISVMDAWMRLSCPKCRAIDWSRDGLTLAVDINGEIHRVRVRDVRPENRDGRWECERCGFQPVAGSDLAVHLVEVKLVLGY